jgi:hypothetical protein
MTVMKTFNSTANLSKDAASSRMNGTHEVNRRLDTMQRKVVAFFLHFSLGIERKGRPHFDLAMTESHRDSMFADNNCCILPKQ